MSAFNGAGTFVISGVGLPYVTGTTISSTVANQLNNDLATGLSTCLTKDGQTTPIANIPLGGFKLTNVGAPTAPGDALVFGQPATVSNLTVTGNGTVAGNLTVAGTLTGAGVAGANLIINGEGRINQRFGIGVLSVLATAQYVPDRWVGFATNAGKIGMISSVGAASVVAGIPASYFMALISQSAYVPAAGEAFGTSQAIEGFNCQSLLWGTANAQPVTLSFWARTNVPGLFGGSLRNGATNRSYTFSYTMAAANVWQKITVTIPGDTAGTWTVDNSAGMYVFLCVASGATFQTAPGVWTPGNFFTVPGQVNLVSANAQEFLFTAVKLERSSVATPFVPDDYEVSLAKCMRYYWRDSTARNYSCVIDGGAGEYPTAIVQFPMAMRVQPSMAIVVRGSVGYSNSANVNTSFNPTGGAEQSLTSLFGGHFRLALITNPQGAANSGKAGIWALQLQADAEL